MKTTSSLPRTTAADGFDWLFPYGTLVVRSVTVNLGKHTASARKAPSDWDDLADARSLLWEGYSGAVVEIADLSMCSICGKPAPNSKGKFCKHLDGHKQGLPYSRQEI